MTSRRRGKDPFPGYGGKPMSPLLSIGVVLLAMGFGTGAWVIGSTEGGYDQVEKLASVKCLGCLGLDPVIPPFEGFWIDYPEDHEKKDEEVPHPEIVLTTIDDEDVDIFVLFFWTQGCVPCADQWDEMVEAGVASGPEDSGIQGSFFERFRMTSYDAAEIEGRELYGLYIPTGKETGVPMTTFIFRGPHDNVQWYSHYGRMETEAMMEMVADIQFYLETGNLKNDYDDIAHAGSDE
ncbi:MAG: hypothetical protein U9R75_05550 [Candidatus Thermoplasmatota archaeon]|nr:hypothetical protein [Candidatus Thermoplasmatota archaeon]